MNAQTNLPAERKELPPIVKLSNQLEQRSVEFKKALPSHITPEKLQRTIVTAATNNPDLLSADRQSLIVAAMKAAQDGLLPDGREAALVVFNTREKGADGQWYTRKLIQYMPMVYGLRKKILQSGEVSTMTVGVVYRTEYESGAFYYEEGTNSTLRHKPMLEMSMDQIADSEIVAFYSMVRMKDGSLSYDVMMRAKVDRIRELSQTGATKDRKGQPRQPKGPWVDHYAEMGMKTVMRHHSKTLPMSGDIIIDVEGREIEAAESASRLLDSTDGSQPVAVLEDQSGTETGVPLDIDNDTGEVLARDDATGRTIEDEETARQLDAGETQGEAEQEEGDATAEGEVEPEPVWKAFAAKVDDMIAKANDRASWEKAEQEFVKIAGGLPDAEKNRLDSALEDKRDALIKQLENATQAG